MSSGCDNKDNMRIQLKVDILNSQATAFQKKINKAMDEIEKMTLAYDNIMEELHSIQNKTRTVVDESEAGLPNIGDNTEIWERIASAHRKAEDDEVFTAVKKTLPSVKETKEPMSRLSSPESLTISEDTEDNNMPDIMESPIFDMLKHR